MSDADLTAEFAEGWRPEEGDTLVGVVTDLSSAWSDYTSSFYPIITVRKDDGSEVAVHCFHHSLKTRMVALRPTVGEKIGIKYKGKQKTKDGKREVAVYIVRIEGRSEDIWGSMSAPVPASNPPVQQSDFTPPTDDDIPF